MPQSYESWLASVLYVPPGRALRCSDCKEVILDSEEYITCECGKDLCHECQRFHKDCEALFGGFR